MKKTTYLFFTTLVAMSHSLYGQGSIYLELKPLQFISSGYAATVHYAINKQWYVGVSVFESELADFLESSAFDIDGDDEITIIQNFSYNVSLRYFFKESGKGLWLGLPLGVETFDFEADDTDDRATDYQMIYSGPRIGYLAHLFNSEFYVLGELAAIVPLSRNDRTLVEKTAIEGRSFFPLPGFAIGYRFR